MFNIHLGLLRCLTESIIILVWRIHADRWEEAIPLLKEKVKCFEFAGSTSIIQALQQKYFALSYT